MASLPIELEPGVFYEARDWPTTFEIRFVRREGDKCYVFERNTCGHWYVDYPTLTGMLISGNLVRASGEIRSC